VTREAMWVARPTLPGAAADESGVPKEMRRMDGAPLVSVRTAMN
jgi:hypothetical protein